MAPCPISTALQSKVTQRSSFNFTKADDEEGVTVDLCIQAIPLPRQGSCLSPQPIFPAAWRMVSLRPTLWSTCPVMEIDPSSEAFFRRSSTGSIPSLPAIISKWDSMAQVIWGIPNPRKAPPLGLLVRAQEE